MIKPADQRNPIEPLLFQRSVDALSDGDAPMLTDSTESLFDAEGREEVGYLTTSALAKPLCWSLTRCFGGPKVRNASSKTAMMPFAL